MDLTAQQKQALDSYAELQKSHPEQFKHRELRPILTDRELLENYAAEHGVVLGVAAETRFFVFLNDLVQQAQRPPYVYSRLIHVGEMNGGSNIAVLAIIDDPRLGTPGSIVMVEQERHATGEIETGIPRGFGEPGEQPLPGALRELAEETGYVGSEPEFLGRMIIDSGSGDARVCFYRVKVRAQLPAAAEATEAIRRIRLISLPELQAAIRSGEITDSFTVQALALAPLTSADTGGVAS